MYSLIGGGLFLVIVAFILLKNIKLRKSESTLKLELEGFYQTEKKLNLHFINQLEKNIKDDQSGWGLLVTTVFPNEALNDNIWTTFVCGLISTTKMAAGILVISTMLPSNFSNFAR